MVSPELRALTQAAIPDLAQEEKLSRVLEAARSVYRDVSRSGLMEVLGEVSPIAIEAHGPTHLDREVRMRVLIIDS